MSDSVVLSFWQADRSRDLAQHLADDAIFTSPVADYHGRDDATHMLGLIATVLGDITETSQWRGERDGVFAFTAQVEDHHLQGMLREERDASDRITHVTLFLRPLGTLRLAIAEMARRLQDSPLPSQAG
ncbi:hypothetical protein [Nocardia arthritidis]|uniref:hypothetical protein n=1 Tax=Nocardia arthritidis TaxID=228602 RepID=UPI0007A3C21F|nr:hypothetical protein [Nocardia arthritidis]